MEALLEEVRSHPVIWDTTLEIYRDQVMRNAAWEEIASNLQRDKFQLMGDWKKLIDSHRQAVYRRKTTTGQAAKKLRKWKYEDEMQFVLKTMYHRPSNTNVPFDDDEDEDISVDDPQQRNTLTSEETNVDSDLNTDTNAVGLTPTPVSELPKERRHRPQKPVDKVLTFMKEKHESKRTNQQQPDELDHFFASASQSVRKLPRLIQIRLRREITNMICQAEEQCEWERSRSNPHLSRTPTPTISPGSSSTSMHSPTPQPQRMGFIPIQHPNHFETSQWSSHTTSDHTGIHHDFGPGSHEPSEYVGQNTSSDQF